MVNRLLSFGGLFDVNVHWLTGQPVVVVLGLVYGYVPYMILPLYAGLDRLPQSTLEAARDLGANRFGSFWRVTLPMCRPTIVAAVLLTCLPMLGDYFTSDMLSASPKTAMVGNLINDSVQAPGQTGQAGAFVMLVLIVTMLPMFYYVRVTSRGDEVADVRSPRHVVERPVAPAAGAGGCHRPIPGVVTAARVDRGGVLVQRRQVPHQLAGLLVPVVLGRSGQVGVARRGAAHRAVPDPQTRGDHHPDHRATRGDVRDRHRPLAGAPAGRGEHADADQLRGTRGAAGGRTAVRGDIADAADHPRYVSTGGGSGDLPDRLSRRIGTGAARHHRQAIRRSRNGSGRRHRSGRFAGSPCRC